MFGKLRKKVEAFWDTNGHETIIVDREGDDIRSVVNTTETEEPRQEE